MARSPAVSYLIALAVTAGAVLLRRALDPWLGNTVPFATVFGAVAIAVWLGGRGPAILVMLVSYLACAWMFVAPRGELRLLVPSNVLGFLLYAISCATIIAIGHAMRMARRDAEASRVLSEQGLERRRDAEEGLRHRTEEIERLLEILPVAVWVSRDPECRDVTGNLQAERLFGAHAAAGFASRPPGIRHLHDGRELTLGELPLQRTISTGRPLENLEYDVEQPDGRTVHLLCNTVPLRGGDGRVRGAVAACLDVSPMKMVERRVRESEERFRSMANTAPAILWTADADGKTTFRNRRWFEFTGLEVEGDPADLPSRVLHPEDLERVMAAWRQALESGKAWEVEARHRRHDGDYRWLLTRATPIRDRAGQIVEWVGSTTDITELRAAQEALVEADRRKDEFLATLAHELRNPLAPIRNAVQVLKTNGPQHPDLAWSRDVIERQVAQMARLLDDLLDVNRIVRSRIELRKSRVTLASVVETAIETSRPFIDESGHALSVVLPDHPVHLDADPVRLAQVFSNLLNNAAKYTPDRGRIQLAAERVSDASRREVVVRVTDTGIGIVPDMLPRIFEMFSQAEPALERAQGGLGIGLSLVKALVGMHGGTIRAYSDGVGRGSTFEVRLPEAAEEAPQAVPARDAPPASAARCRVLIVDDWRDSADSLALLLSTMGHDVRTAYDGEEALAAAAAFEPDLVLLDIGLPKLNGYAVCQRIRQEPWGKDMCVIALTGWGHEDDRRRSEAAGFDRHLVKPVDPVELTRLLGALPRGRVVT